MADLSNCAESLLVRLVRLLCHDPILVEPLLAVRRPLTTLSLVTPADSLFSCKGLHHKAHQIDCGCWLWGVLQNQMGRDVVGQLQRIAGQQSKIRSLRNRLALLDAALTKEAENFAELVLVTRVPAAYRQCLAECMRR